MRQTIEPHAPVSTETAIRNAVDCADALTRALREAARLGIRLHVKVETEEAESGQPSCSRVLVGTPQHDEGRRPEDLNSSNDG
ncbi:hypothetical protein [Aurantimonas sp. VKM B-3413]|uniref:hypothetical protein n=1 Tax=Aurantimonas sp. VKM B-3413 TaxID=2779401 RepID=UPI001E3FD446|nr:hypothetical protein [Aurantimonas sp. VKM B-3413]MCB8836178.1 hypothetical protein [Aurantimonas sp. VKM B-3413]